MPDGLSGTLDTTATLLFFALPMSVVAGGALFVPWRHKWWNLRHWTSVLGRHGWVIAGLVLMLVPEVIESQLDPHITAWLGWDFTYVVAGFDGGLHVTLQHALPFQILHFVMTFVYVAGYPFLIIFTIMLGVWMNDGVLARRALGAYALCYALALPFYLFFPVREVWSYDPSVTNIATSYAWVREHLYSFNEINNCFPSLHTGISAAMAGVAWHGPSRAYRVVSAILAVLIAFSTVYLGIHWALDVVAGLVVAFVSVRAARRLWPSEPLKDPPEILAAA